MKRIAVLTFLFLVVLLAVSAPVESGSVKTYIVQAESAEIAAAVVTQVGGQVNESLPIIQGVSADLTNAQMKRLQQDGRIRSVFADQTVRTTGWEAPTVYFPQVVGADQAWNQGIDGTGITVAVVDTGIAAFNWNTGRIRARYDALDNGPALLDKNGHGTFIAGIIGSDRQDQSGYVGIAPKIKFVDVRVLGEDGSGNYTDVIQGLNWILAGRLLNSSSKKLGMLGSSCISRPTPCP